MIPIKMSLALIVGLSCVIAFPHYSRSDVVDEYVASLNGPKTGAELSIKRANRPQGIVNRLDVLFEEGLSITVRVEVLRRIGKEFSRLVFDWRSVPTVRIVERDTIGNILNSIVVTVTNAPIDRSRVPSSGSSC